MKINFLLPTPGHHPLGGYKVVYEYANGLVALGHQVSITHQMMKVPGAGAPRQWARYVKSRVKGDWLPTDWFKIDPRVRMRLVIDFTPGSLGDADVLVATAWETAEVAATMPDCCGRKYYFIQHFEEWSGDRDRVLATWRLPLKKIVIADWLRQIAIGEGESADYIPNGVDQTAFAIDVPLLDRDPHTVMMLYHTFDWKGSNDGLAALRAVKREVPDMKVILFGVPNEPPNLEDWIEYHQLPSQPALRALYNRAAIFIAPSWAEGWPLPPAEAMLCGAATVLTDIGGHREFGKDGQTTLFAKANDPDSFVQPLFALLNDSALRIQISQRALTYIQNFTWLRATIAMEQALMEPPNGRS